MASKEAIQVKLSNMPASKGKITFPNPEKQEYTLNEILDLIKHNFGYSPLPHGTTVPKAECQNYRNLTQTIRRYLEGKELSHSIKRKRSYSKDTVYKLLNYDMFDYLMKKANVNAEYREHIKEIHQEAQKNLTANNNPIFIQSQEELLLWNAKLKILMDYFEKHIITINEELLKDDIHTFVESEGLHINSLSDDKYFAINRFLGHIDEYYSLKEKEKKKPEETKTK